MTAAGDTVDNWDAVAKAITERLTETRQTQMDVAASAGVSLTTLRELQRNINARRRQPRTLAAISEALGWPPNYLEQILHGEQPHPHPAETDDPVLGKLDDVLEQLHELRTRVEAIEQQADTNTQP